MRQVGPRSGDRVGGRRSDPGDVDDGARDVRGHVDGQVDRERWVARSDRAGIADLAAALGVERGAVEEDVDEPVFDDLDAPPTMITGADVPMPYAANLEKLALPSVEKIVAAASMITTLLLLIASIFLPLKFGTAWFYVGIGIYLVGLVMFMMPIFTIAKTPAGQPFTDGMYRYSRHPMVIGESLTFIGAGLATAWPLFVALAIVLMFVSMRLAVAEERGCLEIYGDAYQVYLEKTSRWIGVPKSGPQSLLGK